MGNCADMRVSPSGTGPAPTAAPSSTTAAPPVTTTAPATSTTSTSTSSTSTTELPSTTTSTHGAGGMQCRGNPARWTTDEQCAQCATGYKWWPCNEAELCFCTSALTQLHADEPRKRQIKSHKFLSQ